MIPFFSSWQRVRVSFKISPRQGDRYVSCPMLKNSSISALAGYIIRELFDDEFLLGDDRFDHITNRDHSHHLV